MVDLIIANSRAGAAFNQQLLGYDASFYRVVHNGVDTRRFRPGDGGTLRAALGDRAPTSGWSACSRASSAQKNHPLAFAAARLVLDRLPRTRFVFVGDMLWAGLHGSAEYKQRMDALVDELGHPRTLPVPRQPQRCRRALPRLRRHAAAVAVRGHAQRRARIARQRRAGGGDRRRRQPAVSPEGEVGHVVPLGGRGGLAGRLRGPAAPTIRAVRPAPPRAPGWSASSRRRARREDRRDLSGVPRAAVPPALTRRGARDRRRLNGRRPRAILRGHVRGSGPRRTAPEEEQRQTTPFLVLQFFVFPMAIVAACVAVFVVFGLISSDAKTARDHLADVRRGGGMFGVKRWQAAFAFASALDSDEGGDEARSRAREGDAGPLRGIEERRPARAALPGAGARPHARPGRRARAARRRAQPRRAIQTAETVVHAVLALGVLGDPAAVPDLIALASQPDAGLRKVAAAFAARLRPGGRPQRAAARPGRLRGGRALERGARPRSLARPGRGARDRADARPRTTRERARASRPTRRTTSCWRR